jgi:hypothetical protein
MRLRLALICAGSLALGACSVPGSSVVGGNPDGAARNVANAGCYPENGARSTVTATVTFYGWPDNTPPGNAIAHPVIHQHAGGDGTYCNPTTFATEPTRAENALIPYGTRIYVPFLKHYFIREDDCTPSGPPVGSGNNGCYKIWFDLWVGGNGASNTNAVVNCENALTPGHQIRVIVNPADGLPVKRPGALYRNDPAPAGTCFGKPGSTAPPGRGMTRASSRA